MSYSKARNHFEKARNNTTDLGIIDMLEADEYRTPSVNSTDSTSALDRIVIAPTSLWGRVQAIGGTSQPLECLSMPRMDFPLGPMLNVVLVPGSQPSRGRSRSSRPGGLYP
jgi:hypothetical protein